MDAQLKRGLVEVCVLSALRDEDSYGYRIIRDLNEYVELSESTLYPILKRLEQGGLVEVYTREHNSRLRRYYRITAAGRTRLTDFKAEWQEMERICAFINREDRYEQG